MIVAFGLLALAVVTGLCWYPTPSRRLFVSRVVGGAAATATSTSPE
ncbi:hypothetical protein [Streptomyces sp. Ag109_O5-1]|nr:hypothetical protein [Streptomyces sp. Ag109_O5-1]